MSAQLSNKINKLCYKLEKLNQKETKLEDKAYLFAVIDNTNQSILFPIQAIVPYNTTLNSKNITLNANGSCKIEISGVYRITFKIYLLSTTVGDIQLGITVNNNVILNRFTTSYISVNFVTSTTSIDLDNNILISLNKGDIISIINSSALTTLSIETYNTNSKFDNNITIEKIY
jgi:hypothetical protein